jgi:hypothetical protein
MRFVAAILTALCATLLFGGNGAQAQGLFYQASPQDIAGPPRTIIRKEPMAPTLSGGSAYRVLYRSTGLHNEPIAVSGIVIVPPGPAPAAAGRLSPGRIRRRASCRAARRRWRSSFSSRSKGCGS